MQWTVYRVRFRWWLTLKVCRGTKKIKRHCSNLFLGVWSRLDSSCMENWLQIYSVLFVLHCINFGFFRDLFYRIYNFPFFTIYSSIKFNMLELDLIFLTVNLDLLPTIKSSPLKISQIFLDSFFKKALHFWTDLIHFSLKTTKISWGRNENFGMCDSKLKILFVFVKKFS